MYKNDKGYIKYVQHYDMTDQYENTDKNMEIIHEQQKHC